MARTSGYSAFVSAIEAECRAFQQFLEILKSEHDALDSGNIDCLPGLAQSKQDQVIALKQLIDARNAHLVALSLSADRRGMDGWLKQNDAPGGVTETWRRVLEFAEAARDLNQGNGAMIEARLHLNQQALAALHAAAQQANGLYGADGQTHGASSSNPLSTA
ncbi:MAG: flagella synthesis protein FlgN [Burkholderiales bacterium]